jgi:hypothetical protein
MKLSNKEFLRLLMTFFFGVLVTFLVYSMKEEKVEVISDLQPTKEIEYLAPTCATSCPEYSKYYFQNGLLAIAVERIAMTRGAGRIWVVDGKGKLLYRSNEEAQMSYSVDEEKETVTISYASEYDDYAIVPKVITEEEWKIENGEFKLANTNNIDIPNAEAWEDMVLGN